MPRLPPELIAAERQQGTSNDPMAMLTQTENIAEIDKIGTGEWTVLYEYQDSANESRCSYSAFLPADLVNNAMTHDSLDLSIGHGMPGFSQSDFTGQTVTTYDRFGFARVEPILYVRDFHGLKPRQFEISEEFRHYHNLYHDRRNDRYIYLDHRGEDVVVVEVEPQRVRAKTRFLRQYMAARQLHLALYFDHRAYASVDVAVAKSMPPNRVVSTDRCYSFNKGEFSRDRAFSRLIGKRVIAPPPISECGVWPFELPRDQYVEYVIGTSDDGQDVLHSCDPGQLANYFGANEGSPHYLTPVWFTRNVLSKYYDNPDKFSVEDGYLRCGSLWGLQIDNSLPDHVVVYLGDLGRDLAYEEQTYWRHFNINPASRRTSETNFKRAFLAQFADPSAPDLVFKQRYRELQEAWAHRYGWSLFRPLHESDTHIFKQLRVPLTDGLGEFETQTMYLVKLLIDSLNDKELARECGGALPNEQSISKLERYLSAKSYPEKVRDIGILRLLQDVRSTAAAHAKGEKFDKLSERVGLNSKSPREIFVELLKTVNTMLADMSAYFTPVV
ncbi:MAG TPA: hypothetical protein VMU78_05265 [Methylocella sp.]|nr:hypothetical protein [Methylocella sp.]